MPLSWQALKSYPSQSKSPYYYPQIAAILFAKALDAAALLLLRTWRSPSDELVVMLPSAMLPPPSTLLKGNGHLNV